MAMTPEQCQALSQRLQTAEAAYHDLQTGRSARVLVDQNGERVEYTAANHFRLNTYIQMLRNQLQDHCGIDAGGPRRVKGPMRVLFG